MTPADNGDIIILHNNNICSTLIDSGLFLFSRSELRISLTVRIFGFYTVAFLCIALVRAKEIEEIHTQYSRTNMFFVIYLLIIAALTMASSVPQHIHMRAIPGVTITRQ